MLDEYLAKLNDLEAEIAKFIELDDTEQVQKIDREHSRIWEELLNYSPTNDTDFKRYILFFIDHLIQRLEDSPENLRIRNRIDALLQERF